MMIEDLKGGDYHPSKQSKILKIVLFLIFFVVLALLIVQSLNTGSINADKYVSKLYGTAFALLPPIIAIGMALITKEVYSSLFLGIVTGALLYSEGNLELFYNTLFYNKKGGMITTISNESRVSILVFLVTLAWVTALINKSGGAKAFGEYAKKHIKTRIGAQLLTMLLGIVIFIDDYFNCLTVGSVMKPVTDKYNVSRAKLSYLIDATAAPVCIIAPISSWAAAVTYSVPKDANVNGFVMFLRTIPYNFYALLTIAFMIFIITRKVEYGEMRIHEKNAIDGDIFTSHKLEDNTNNINSDKIGRVSDLIIPIIVLIGAAIFFMLYTGDFFKGKSFVDAFSSCNSGKSLVMASGVSILFMFCLYLLEGTLSFIEFMNSLLEGFKNMCGAILILIFAWTLSSMTSLLGADVFIHNIVEGSAGGFTMFFPFILFLISVVLSFATGTSWGTFTVLIPIVCEVFTNANELQVIAIAAVLAGSICGDHCSPISDTTIMSSAGARCYHINHVRTQLTYAMTVAGFSAIGFLIAGIIGYLTESPMSMIVMPLMIFIVYLFIEILRKRGNIVNDKVLKPLK